MSGTVAADAFAEVSPGRVAEARALLAVVVLVPYAFFRRRLDPRGQLPLLALLGLNLAVVNVTYYLAIDLLGVGPGATLQFLAPFLVLAWMGVVQRRRVSTVTWGAAALAVLGVAMVTQAWQLSGSDWAGLLAGLAAALTFASYLLLGERLGRQLPPVTVVTWGFVFATVFWLVVQPLWSFSTDLSGKVWLELVWVGVLGTALPFIAEVTALRRVAAGIVGVIATAEPVIAAVSAWVLLGQGLSPGQVLGGLMVLAAVAWIQQVDVAHPEVPYDAAR